MVRLFSFVLAVGALCCEGAAHADSVNKCKDARGRTVYQSDPCEVSGAHFVKAVTAPPRLNGETASAVQLASAQPVADSITPECRLLREDKKNAMKTKPASARMPGSRPTMTGSSSAWPPSAASRSKRNSPFG